MTNKIANLFSKILISVLFCSISTTAQNKEVIEFTYKDNNAFEVSLIGNFNRWDSYSNQLTKIDSQWIGYVALEPGYYYYQFLVDGRKITDPKNDWITGTDSLNKQSVILVGDPERPIRRTNPFQLRKSLLPAIIFSKDSLLVELYDKAWQTAWDAVYFGNAENGFVKQYFSNGIAEKIDQWESMFLSAFSVYSNGVFPSMETLDNFYNKQDGDGYIQRNYLIRNGEKAYDWSLSNPYISAPLFAWLELRYYHITGDKSRLRKKAPVLIRHYNWINSKLNDKLKLGLFYNTPAGSGMTNLPRPNVNQSVYIDMSAQMGLAAKSLMEIGKIINRRDFVRNFQSNYNNIKFAIVDYCWNWNDNFYYDLRTNQNVSGVKHLGAYWTLLSEICPENQLDFFSEHLLRKDEFGAANLLPTISMNSRFYDERGNGWLGSVKTETNFMVVKGLEKYGRIELANQIAKNYIQNVKNTYFNPGLNEDRISFEDLYGDGYNTFWDGYSPLNNLPATSPGNNFYVHQNDAKTALGTITLIIENLLGFEIIGSENKIIWRINEAGNLGIKKLKFNGQFVSLLSDETANGRTFEVKCQKPFTLQIEWNGKTFRPGLNSGINIFDSN